MSADFRMLTEVERLSKQNVFPLEGRADGGTWQTCGITKRELFAAMAMQGSLGGEPGSHLEPRRLAIESVRYADALIAELAKEPAP
jgi:hypothetical protein